MHREPITRLARALLLALSLATTTTVAPAAHAEGPPRQQPCTETKAETLNINTASARELERLPRIGPARAQAIVRLREHLGGFKRPSQLLRVKGIGRATLRGLLPLIRLADPPGAEEGAEEEGAAASDPVP